MRRRIILSYSDVTCLLLDWFTFKSDSPKCALFPIFKLSLLITLLMWFCITPSFSPKLKKEKHTTMRAKKEAPENLTQDTDMPFRHGSIMQVMVSLSLFLQVLTFSKLSNFMCVDNLSYDFHPRLNFVVGPNGSGKSTLVCAIYLCLNGDVKKLGRGSSLVHYINHARPEMPASVTVVLCEKSKLFRKLI